MYQGARYLPRLDAEVWPCPRAGVGWVGGRQSGCQAWAGAGSPGAGREAERQAEGGREEGSRSTGLPQAWWLCARPRGSSGSSPHGPRGETGTERRKHGPGSHSAEALKAAGPCGRTSWWWVHCRVFPAGRRGEHLSHGDASVTSGSPRGQKGTWKTLSPSPSGYSGDRDWQFLKRVPDTPVCPPGRAVAVCRWLSHRRHLPRLPPWLLSHSTGCLAGREWGVCVMQHDGSGTSVGSGINTAHKGSLRGQ